MQTLQIVTAATREARQGGAVAAWMIEQATQHGTFEIEPVDLADVDLPLFDEPKHPRFAEYAHEHTKRWSAIVSRADAFVFVTPEYDFGPPAALVNALQHLVREWAYKPVGFVSYGGVSAGLRGVQITKQICSALKLVPLFEAVAIPFFAQHIDPVTKRFDPGELQVKAAATMLDELARWAQALRVLRSPAASA